MNRVPNWNVKLVDLATELIGRPFEWGETDCVSVARKALVAQFGEDPVTKVYNGRYTTKTGAIRVFNRLGSIATIAQKAGAVEISPVNARDGDFMIFPKRDDGYENVATRMGDLWIISDIESNMVVSRKIKITSMDPDVRVFRF